MRGSDQTGARFVYGDDLFADGWGTNEDAFDELHELFGKQGLMSFPKPTKLLAKLILAVCRNDKDAVVLDFFAGSGTTADALMQLNSADQGQRSYIVVQLAEDVPINSEPAKAGFDTIADLARARIKAAGMKIKRDSSLEPIDTGFRAFRVDTTNMVDVVRSPDNTDQLLLGQLVSSTKPGRSSEDLLFQVLLDWGLELTMKIDVEHVDGHDVFVVENGALIACFDSEVGLEIVRTIADRKPLRAVFCDTSFASDDARINAEQIFREASPATDVKAI